MHSKTTNQVVKCHDKNISQCELKALLINLLINFIFLLFSGIHFQSKHKTSLLLLSKIHVYGFLARVKKKKKSLN